MIYIIHDKGHECQPKLFNKSLHLKQKQISDAY